MCEHCMNRREFGGLATAGLAGGIVGLTSAVAAEGLQVEPWDPDKPPVVTGRALRVQPVLAHGVMAPREKTSWRSWSDIINETSTAEEMQRIARELKDLKAKADFPLEILPLAKVTTAEQAGNLQKGDFDVVLLYAASNAGLFRPCCAAAPKRDTIVFVRHKSGPVYYGYECLGTRFFQVPSPELWQHNSADNHGPVTLDDMVVDDYGEVSWRLRGLYGLKNFIGERMLALGGALGKWDPSASRGGTHALQAGHRADRLQGPGGPLGTNPIGWEASRAVRGLDRSLPGHAAYQAGNEEGVRPAGVRHLHGVPAVVSRVQSLRHHGGLLHGDDLWRVEHSRLHAAELAERRRLHSLLRVGLRRHAAGDLVAPHCRQAGVHAQFDLPAQGDGHLRHCTAPRRMDGKRYEPARIMTHFESDFAAAPKVEMPIGQPVCAISPEYAKPRWVGIKGIVRDNPCYAICRSQQDVEIVGHWKRLIAETRDSHWMMVYGDYLREVGYAVRKIGLRWDNTADTEG